MKQSPIDIITNETVKMYEGPLMWKNNATSLGNVTIKNGGHGFSVSGDAMAGLLLSGGGLTGEYKLAQFHFHWGSNANQFKGSEHRIDGKQTASEMHMVHHKTKYADLVAALAGGEEDALAVVGVMLTKANRAAAGHETLLKENLQNVTKYEASIVVDLGNLKLLDLLPGDVTEFFRYHGSLTTPTCNEAVIWTVLEEEVTIAQSLLDEFPKIEDSQNNTLTYSARGAMDLHGREVKFNTEKNGGISTFLLPSHAIFALVTATLTFLL